MGIYARKQRANGACRVRRPEAVQTKKSISPKGFTDNRPQVICLKTYAAMANQKAYASGMHENGRFPGRHTRVFPKTGSSLSPVANQRFQQSNISLLPQGRTPPVSRPVVQQLSFRKLLNKIASYIPGYSMFTLIIGKNPITRRSVPRTGVNLLKGIMGMIPGFGMFWFNQLKKSGAAQEAGSWLEGQFLRLNITWPVIKGLIGQFRKRFYYRFWKNKQLIKDIFSPAWNRVVRFTRNIGGKLKELAIRGFLTLVGAPVNTIMGFLNKGKKVLGRIIHNFPGFVSNLFGAAKLGLGMFFKNIKKHAAKGVLGWLLSTLAKTGLALPSKFNLAGIFSIVTQATGLTYAYIRKKIVEKLGPKGETIMKWLEKASGFVKNLMIKGPIALLKRIRTSLSNLKPMVMGAIKTFVISTVIKEGIFWILGLLNPAGALLKVIKAFHKVTSFFINNIHHLLFIKEIFNAVSEIAFGRIKKAAGAVETSMAMTLPMVIGAVANFLGLGDLAKTVVGFIKKAGGWVKGKINAVVAWIVAKAKKLFKGRGKKGGKHLTAADRARHQKYASNMARALKAPAKRTPISFEVFYREKKSQAQKLESIYQKKVKKGIQVAVNFQPIEKDRKDLDLDIKIRIFPNTATENIQVPLNGPKLISAKSQGCKVVKHIQDIVTAKQGNCRTWQSEYQTSRNYLFHLADKLQTSISGKNTPNIVALCMDVNQKTDSHKLHLAYNSESKNLAKRLTSNIKNWNDSQIKKLKAHNLDAKQKIVLPKSTPSQVLLLEYADTKDEGGKPLSYGRPEKDQKRAKKISNVLVLNLNILECVKDMKNPSTTLHAEMNLVDNGAITDNQLLYISKACCLLCAGSLFIDGRYKFMDLHSRLYNYWRIPNFIKNTRLSSFLGSQVENDLNQVTEGKQAWYKSSENEPKPITTKEDAINYFQANWEYFKKN
jgi:OTT_1508-like deaminase